MYVMKYSVTQNIQSSSNKLARMIRNMSMHEPTSILKKIVCLAYDKI